MISQHEHIYWYCCLQVRIILCPSPELIVTRKYFIFSAIRLLCIDDAYSFWYFLYVLVLCCIYTAYFFYTELMNLVSRLMFEINLWPSRLQINFLLRSIESDSETESFNDLFCVGQVNKVYVNFSFSKWQTDLASWCRWPRFPVCSWCPHRPSALYRRAGPDVRGGPAQSLWWRCCSLFLWLFPRSQHWSEILQT